MTDRELLELAAKAAGLNISEWTDDYDTGCFGHPDNGGDGFVIHGACTTVLWNPLTDDGDALRLAVALKIQIIIYQEWVECLIDGIRMGNACSSYAVDGCMHETTRRAIVRAAAEIGRAMS